MANELSISPFSTSAYIGWKIFQYLKSNQLDEADNVINEYGLSLGKKKTHTNEMAYMSYAQLLLAQGKYNEAEVLISELYTLVNEGKRIEGIIQTKVLYAILYKMTGRRKMAITSLMEAMEIASEERLLSYFIFNIKYIKDLLQEIYKIHPTTNTNIPKKFIDNLKLAIVKSKDRKKIHIENELSSRELETLKLIAEDLTNQNIADELFISITTVKTHVRNILLKLEAKNRTEAVLKAKKKGII